MHARVSILEGSPERVDDAINEARNQVVPKLRELEGSKGILLLVDRQSGKAMAVTLWESEEALRASEETANQLREQTAEAADDRITGVERYEVVIDERS